MTAGIIGGMGPLATAHLFERIIFRTKADKDQEHIHVIIDSNPEIPDRTAAILHNGADPVPSLSQSAQRLEKAGADFLMIPCNTAHFFINRVQSTVKIPIINMLEKTVLSVSQKYPSIKKIGLLATDGTIQTGIYKTYFDKAGIETITPLKTQKSVMHFIYEIIKKSNFAEGTKTLLDAVEELKSLGAEAFILGCTELSSAQYLFKLEGAYINPLEVLAEETIKMAGYQLRS